MDERDLGTGHLQDVTVLTGGTQNILLRFDRSGRSYVLRHPPLHKRRNSDETMRREARVLAALAGTDVPHPGLIAAEPDTDVLGAAFYLMEPIEGFNPAAGLPEPHRSDPAMRHAMGLSMADAAAALSRVDHEAVGLGDFGRPDGWLERQVDRWRSQLVGYGDLDGYPGPDIPGVDRVAAWLDDHRPDSWTPGIIHGDLHFANVLVRNDGPELAAVVDWELCTIGDPLLDLGHLLSTWPGGEDGNGPGGVGGGIADLPDKDELVAHYAAASGRSVDHVDWYHVLAAYRLGIILEGTHARAFAGKAPKEIGDLLHATTVGLFERALAVIDGT
ncbi:phosphotransferase family protein [Actinospongicola halichondriae]|uniref:phosphotransferase family protein n=1 Tax=Actinospongicola halichondriae TaxID=3236844 RepID=UPI003D48FD61